MPAAWPSTAQHDMLRVAACDTRSPPDERPATSRLSIALRQQIAVRQLEVAAGGRQDQNAVAVDELGVDPDRVVEPALLANVVFGHVVDGVDLAGVADADRHAEVAQPGPSNSRACSLRSASMACIAWRRPSISPRVIESGSVPSTSREVHDVHVRQLAGVVDRTPGSGERGEVVGDHAVADRLGERLVEERREHVVLLARRSRCPRPRCPPSRDRSAGRRATPSMKARLSTPARWNITDAAIICSRRRQVRRRAGPVGDVGVAGRVDDAAGEDRLAAGLRLGDDADHAGAVHDRRHETAVQHRVHAGLLDERVGDHLEALGVEFERVAIGSRERRPPSREPASRTRGRSRLPRRSARGGTTPCPRRRRW